MIYLQTLLKKRKKYEEIIRARILVSEYPSIYRIITELSSWKKHIHTKQFMIYFISGFLVVAIGVMSHDIQQNLNQAREVRAQKEKVEGEIKAWEHVAAQYSNYRDVYFRLATLEYSLGHKDKAKQYISKALEIDPNFIRGKVFAAQLED